MRETTTEAAELNIPELGSPLAWTTHDDGYVASNTAGLVNDEGESTGFYIDPGSDPNKQSEWYVNADDLRLLTPLPPGTFEKEEAAKAWCEQRNAELAIQNAKPDETPVGSAGPAKSTTPDADHWAQIVLAREAERKAESRVVLAQEEVKLAKADRDAASERLGRLIDESNTPSLFNLPKSDAPAPAPTDESWRDEPLASIGVNGKAQTALLSHTPPITTLGELSDHQLKHGEDWADEIRGFGAKGKESVEKAWEEFWAKWNAGTAEANNESREDAIAEIGDAILASGGDPEAFADMVAESPAVAAAIEEVVRCDPTHRIPLTDTAWVDVVQLGEKFAARPHCAIGKATMPPPPAVAKHDTREDAIAAGAEGIRDFVIKTRMKGFRGGQQHTADAIEKALESLTVGA